jgi:16S rRNA (uracil1498-N3)-methyltransferase
MHRFFSRPENYDSTHVVLNESETRHLRDVLRLNIGEIVHVFDGAGREYQCSVETITKKETRLAIKHEISPAAPESNLDLTVAAAITPGEKFDLAIQKSVELGVRRFIPLATARCEVKLKDAEKRIERWRRIAFEAAKQCGRARLMDLHSVTAFKDVFNNAESPIVIFSERDGVSFDSIRTDGKLTAVYGPKGGWTDEELELARNAGADVITFGGRILRAETAAIAITAILQHRFGDMN